MPELPTGVINRAGPVFPDRRGEAGTLFDRSPIFL